MAVSRVREVHQRKLNFSQLCLRATQWQCQQQIRNGRCNGTAKLEWQRNARNRALVRSRYKKGSTGDQSYSKGDGLQPRDTTAIEVEIGAAQWACTFDCRYGTPDPDGMREYDMRVNLTMSSVWYVHTHHFMQETFAFIQNFNKLQDILGRSRAVASGKKVGIIFDMFVVITLYYSHFSACDSHFHTMFWLNGMVL